METPTSSNTQLLTRSLVGFLALICYGNSSWGKFVFDDTEAIIGNKDVVDPSGTSLQEVFSDDFWGNKLSSNVSHKSYRPLTTLTFRWNYMLAGGLEPFGFHVVNIVLHVIASVLYFEVCTKVCRRSGLSCVHRATAPAVAALLFAVHPIHTESVRMPAS